MLVELSIRDLALFEALELELGPGLNVISGETGAGKSLFVGALELLSGETPKGGAAQWVRRGAEEARVEGRFELAGRQGIEPVLELLRAEVPAVAEAWSETIEGDSVELILGRSLSSAGRTRAHIHQRPVPLRALRALAPLVLEIHGQNDQQLLFAPAEQMRLLDLFGGVQKDVARYDEARSGWSELRARFERLDGNRAERRDRLDLLRFQLGELTDAELEDGEHARLGEERELLRSAASIRAELGGLAIELTESDDALLDRLRSAVRLVERWNASLARLDGALEDLSSAEIHVGEAAAALSSLVDGIPDDPRRLEAVEERLAELERLESKYRADEAGLTELAGELRAEIAQLEGADESLASIEDEIATARSAVQEAAKRLTKKRKALVPKLTKSVERTLAALGLAKARFGVEFTERSGEERFGPGGDSDVEFMLAANPGEDVAPLRKVASGGEAARIMLALRTSLVPAQAGGAGRTLVFDEIDSGVGGRLGPAVGEHLKTLATREQVLCVTHIPAIAAVADLHMCVSKDVQRGRTRTSIQRLSGDERVAEVADMIAGGAAHESARAEARRLLETAG